MKIVMRHWLLMIVLLGATGGAAVLVAGEVAPSYRATATVLLTGPQPRADAANFDPATSPNPFLRVTDGSLNIASGLAAQVVSSASVVDRIVAAGGADDFTVIAGTGLSDSPVLHIAATAESAQMALRTVELLTQAIPEELKARQRALGAPPESWINAVTITTPDQASRLVGSKRRAFIGVVVLGAAFAVSMAFVVESIERRTRGPGGRKARRSGAGTPQPDPDGPATSPPRTRTRSDDADRRSGVTGVASQRQPAGAGRAQASQGPASDPGALPAVAERGVVQAVADAEQRADEARSVADRALERSSKAIWVLQMIMQRDSMAERVAEASQREAAALRANAVLLEREARARQAAEEATQRGAIVLQEALVAAQREAIAHREVQAAAQREADAQRAAQAAAQWEAVAHREAEAAAQREAAAHQEAREAALRRALDPEVTEAGPEKVEEQLQAADAATHRRMAAVEASEEAARRRNLAVGAAETAGLRLVDAEVSAQAAALRAMAATEGAASKAAQLRAVESEDDEDDGRHDDSPQSPHGGEPRYSAG